MATPSEREIKIVPARRKAGRPRNDQKHEIEAAKLAWLAAYPELGWRGACAKAGIASATPFNWIADDKEFRKAHDRQAPSIAAGLASRLDDIAAGRVTVENSAPVTAAIFRLKALRPKMYRENTRVELTGKGGKPLQIEVGDASKGYEAAQRFIEAVLVQPKQIEAQ